ncbi:cell wall-binding repeat-containing protein [Candidatus Poriferisodalis sp.]|uniref:cell wall-binding repeat-containing protein n=1 Tax=Candidatus Poriferisodalis sp. TaxID=3101277 RepID=UPI003AF5619A
MTQPSSGLRRRSLAAVAAALLCATVLAVVAAAPAHAANTASEVLVDTDDDGEGDAREFGGRDRYDTALRLATNFATGKGGSGQVPVAFVASGVTLVDAVSVSGLAGFRDAPVLLTPGDTLHSEVASFIEDYGVGTIHVLGGRGAVADSVLEDMAALSNEPTVGRIQGADRFATAAAIASALDEIPSWCGSDAASAILVNGGDVSLAYAMMVGPVAYRLQLPVLMTQANALPTATAGFIDTEDIEHVVIVGGTEAVSADVQQALTDAGVDTVGRVAGDGAAGTSVALAELAHDDCADDLEPVSGDTVALVHSDALPDGVAAAPVLAATFDDGALVPMLLVGDTLPASVSEYLAETPQEDSDGTKVNLNIVAIGGTGAVSASVVEAAVAAAAAAPDLTVQIGATTDRNNDGVVDANDVPEPGDRAVILYFSDDINPEGTSLTQIIRDIIELNGAPALLAASNAVTHTGVDDVCNPDQVRVSFASELKTGDVVSVAAGAQLGAGTDARRLGTASVTVPRAPVIRIRPTVDVFMIAGRFVAEVTVSDGGPVNEESVVLRSSSSTNTVSVEPGTGNLIFSEELERGDRVTIRSGAVEDVDGNRNAQRSFVAIAAHKNPRITTVLMSNPKYPSHAAATVPRTIGGSRNTIDIVAKASGAAAGAAGNDWSFVFDVASTWTATGASDIEVRVVERDSTVFVRFNNGKATNGDLKAAMEANLDADAMFEMKLPRDAAGGCETALSTELALGTNDRQITASLVGGVTEVAIEARFNGYLESVDDDGLLEDILADTVERSGAVSDLVVRAALDLDAPEPFVGPGMVVRYEARTTDAAMLPQVRDLVTTVAGRDAVFDDPDTNADETADPVPAIATGYAQPEDDEEKNGRSQVRIARSSNVKPPG